MLRKNCLFISIVVTLSGCAEAETYETEACLISGAQQDAALECPARATVNKGDLYPRHSCPSRTEVTEVLSEGRHTPDVAFGISDACCYTVEAVDKDADVECPLS